MFTLCDPSPDARTEQIRDEIKVFPAPVIDRATVQKIFRLRKRQALRLMTDFGGHAAGGARVVDRSRLLQQLSELARRPRVWRSRQELRLRLRPSISVSHQSFSP